MVDQGVRLKRIAVIVIPLLLVLAGALIYRARPVPFNPNEPADADKKLVLSFFDNTVKETLLERAGNARSHLAEIIAKVPVFAGQSDDTGADLQRRIASQFRPGEIVASIAFGSLDAIGSASLYKSISLYFADKRTPLDGGLTLVFVIDKESRQIVFVYRILMG